MAANPSVSSHPIARAPTSSGANDDARSDEGLMAAYASGDDGAFRALLQRFGPKLLGYFMRAFHDRAVAEDLYQTTILKLHRARASYRVGAPFRPWLFGIAVRARADELRRRYRDQAETALAERAGLTPTAPPGPLEEERARRVRNAIDSLPESQRHVVLLHRYAGLSFAEIAALLASEGDAVVEGAVRARAFRAYEKLRSTLSDLEESS